ISNNSPCQSQESTESNSENSIEQNINLDVYKSPHQTYFTYNVPLYKNLAKKTKSKVDVMEYICLNSNIPVPKVYYWNSSVNNLVGSEYILMEYLSGIRLCDIWSDLSMEKKKMFLLKIIDIQLELKKLSFSKIGSIFFDGKNDQFKIGQVIESDFFT
ncbi:25706_t:CDS:2, partial [Racocetra persica]